MPGAEALQEFLTPPVGDASILGFLLNLLLCAALSWGVGRMYVTYGAALSNRRAFAHNFVLLSLTTMLVITIVRSSLALSLGLIGALSIVRFRAAIKEPEELSYLFLAIAIGLGMGADQRFFTVVAVVAILLILAVRRALQGRNPDALRRDLYLTVSAEGATALSLDKIVGVVQQFCRQSEIKRTDVTATSLETLFLVELTNAAGLQSIDSALRQIDERVRVTYLDSR